jgi:hypothetical protein
VVLAPTEDTSKISHKFGEVLRSELSGVDLNTYDETNWDNLIMRLRDKGINVTNYGDGFEDDPSG